MSPTPSTAAPSLEELMDRPDQQTAQIERLQREVERLRSAGPMPSRPRVATSDSDADRSPVTRRGLLGRAGVAAAAAGAATVAAAAAPSAADATVGFMQFGTTNNAGTDPTRLFANTAFDAFAMFNSGDGDVLSCEADGTGSAVVGQVFRSPSTANGVYGKTLAQGSGVRGEVTLVPGATVASTGNGVRGLTPGSGCGVLGEITAATSSGFGVKGTTVGPAAAVYGKSAHAAGPAAVMGDSVGATKAVWGRTGGTNPGGVGVFGASQAGRGASFGGKLAQLRLRPSTATTHPTGGSPGDFFVDSTTRLWFCKGGGVWKQLA